MINKIEITFHYSFHHMVYYGKHAGMTGIKVQIRNKDNNYSFPVSYCAEEVRSLTPLPSWSSRDWPLHEPTLITLTHSHNASKCPELFAKEMFLCITGTKTNRNDLDWYQRQRWARCVRCPAHVPCTGVHARHLCTPLNVDEWNKLHLET